MCSEILGKSHIWKSCSSAPENARGELENVGEPAIGFREGVLATDKHGGEGARGRVGRVHGVVLRRKRQQGVG